jgi:hypothetical protein
MRMHRHRQCLAPLLAASAAWCISDACGAQELERRQFPGFSVELPEGKIASSSQFPFAGRHEVRLPPPTALDRLNPLNHRFSEPRVIVSWGQHGLDNGEYYQLLRGTLLKSLPGTNVRVLKETATSPDINVVVIGDPGVPLAYGTRHCERGFNVDVMVGVSSDVDEQFELAKRIAASIRCALTDANRQRPQAATRLPAGFVRVKHEANPTYLTLSGEQLIVNFTPGNALRDPQAFSAVIKGLMSEALGVPVAEIRTSILPVKSTPERQTGLLQVALTGESGYVGALWCPKTGATFMGIYTSAQSTAARAGELLDSLGCPGEASVEPRDARPLFEASCADGDAAACATLKEFSF